MRQRSARVALIAAAMLVVAAACSSSPSSPRTAIDSGRVATYAEQQSERQQATETYAEQLIAEAPVLSAERQLTTKPPVNLRHPGETIGANDLVVRSRYWSLPEKPDDAYRLLKSAKVATLRLSGYGRPSSSAEDAPGQGFLTFDPEIVPAFVEDTELHLQLEADSSGRTIVAAFAEVAPHPVRQSAEIIEATASEVVIGRVRLGPPTRSAGQVTLGNAQARALISAFNQSPVRGGSCIGGPPPSFDYTVSVTSPGSAWTLNSSGAGCGALSVLHNHKSLASVQPSATYERLLNADYLRGKGFIDGELGAVGGPYGDSVGALYRGKVLAVRDDTVIAHGSAAGPNGSFELAVPAGLYSLIATSPKYENGHSACRSNKPIVVRTNQSAYAAVLCQLK